MIFGCVLTIFASCTRERLVVSPSGRIIQNEIPLSNIHELELSNSFVAYVSFSPNEEKLVIETDDNLMSLVDVKVRNGQVDISMKNNIRLLGRATKVAYLTVHDLSRIDLSGASTVYFEDTLFTPELEAHLSGSSRITGTMNVTYLDADLSGSSEVNFEGHADTYRVHGSGSSRLEGLDLDVNHVDINLSGSSSMHLTVNQTLKAHLSGSSVVYYMGNGVITHQELSGSSRIIKL